jgi:hypothetical protein
MPWTRHSQPDLAGIAAFATLRPMGMGVVAEAFSRAGVSEGSVLGPGRERTGYRVVQRMSLGNSRSPKGDQKREFSRQSFP